MQSDEKSLEAALEKWRKGAASVEDVRDLARDLGGNVYVPGIPVLLELLNDQDEIVRYEAAESLAMNFNYVPATGRLLVMLASDPDEDCRSMAATCLSSLCHDTRDRVVLAALAKSALEDPVEYVRDSAYHSLLFVNGIPEQQQRSIFQNPPHVDPDRVKSILAGVSG